MDKRHRVDHLDSKGRGDRESFRAANELARGDAKNGADALPAGEKGVAHGLVNPARIGEWDGEVESAIDGGRLGEHVALEVEFRWDTHRVLGLRDGGGGGDGGWFPASGGEEQGRRRERRSHCR